MRDTKSRGLRDGTLRSKRDREVRIERWLGFEGWSFENEERWDGD